MKKNKDMKNFFVYLEKDRSLSTSTIGAYHEDLEAFHVFVYGKGIKGYKRVKNTDIDDFVENLKRQDYAPATIRRRISSVRAFYNYLVNTGAMRKNPTLGLKAPKLNKKTIDYFTVEEIDLLLASVTDDTDSGIRDKAVLELMYATGLQLTELLELKMSDVDIRAGLITAGLKKRRVIPIGSHARKAVEKYISDVRKLKFSKLSKKDASSPLFVNYLNKKFSRQGIWKIFKDYATKTGIIKFTPNMLRNSFAVHMLQNGADIKTVQELMGHENISITKQYYIEIPSSTKLVYDKTHPRA